MLKNGGLNPEWFCVTDSTQEAKRFFDANIPGTIALLNDETRAVSNMLRTFNEQASDSQSDDEVYGYAPHVTDAMDLLLHRVTGRRMDSELVKPHGQEGWKDAPHTDGAGTALLCGHERQTEVSSMAPERFDVSGALAEIKWGNSSAGHHPEYGVMAPVSFLPATLIIMTAIQGDPRRTVHRIPRQLYEGEQRGFILKTGYSYAL